MSQASPLLLTVRFSSSHADIHLDIPSPSATPTAALKLLIRAQLPQSFSHRRLRFIYRGRILDDTAALSLIAPPSPDAATATATATATAAQDSDSDSGHDGGPRRGKGKQVASKRGGVVGRIILNCAIGNPDALLSPAELAAEERIAHLRPTARVPTTPSPPPPRPAPSPRGFDRLRNAGLTLAEIAQLRAHFTALQARRHTPDAMPSPDSMRRMEDAWIDGNVGGGGVAAAGTAAAAAAATTAATATTTATATPGLQTMMGVDDGDAAGGQFGVLGMLDSVVSGMAVGFFFPVGAMVWVIRQGGMMAYQESVYVVLGLVLAVATGLMRGFAGGDGGEK